MTARPGRAALGGVLALLGAALAGTGAALVTGSGGDAAAPAVDGALPRPAEVGLASAPTPTITRRPPRPVAKPVRIRVPAIGVRARIIDLGLNRDGTLEVPTRPQDAGWWTGGARPGQRGAAVVAGHVDSKTGPAVFYRLNRLRKGNTIIITRRDGTSVHFVVQRLLQVPKDRFPTRLVYGATSKPTLRLITCSGAFDRGRGHYVDNTIVFAALRR